MADYPQPNGPGLPDQRPYPGLHRNFGCKELSIGTYVWRIQPDETVDQVEDQSARFYWHHTDQSVVS